MLTQLRLITLLTTYFAVCVSASGQEAERILPLPPIESEFLEQGEQPDNSNQDVGYLSDSIPELQSPILEQLPNYRLYWDLDIIVLQTDWGPNRAEDTLSALRYELGLEHRSGLGVRAQYLTLDPTWGVVHSPFATEIIDPHPDDIYTYGPHYKASLLLSREVDNLNLDVFKRIELGEAQIRMGAGLTSIRSIEQFHLIFDDGPADGIYSYMHADKSIKGVGIGLSADLRRPVYVRDTWEVSFLLGGRTSYVPVEEENQSQLISNTVEYDMKLHEGRIGIELLKRLAGVTAIANCQFEVQHWDNEFTDARSFDGVSVSLGLRW